MLSNNFGQFVEISKPDIHLSLYRGFLKINQNKVQVSRIPLDNILGLVITGFGCSHSSNILNALAERGVPVSICGTNFVPKSMILPVVGNTRQSLRIRHQTQMSQSLKKKLWKQIVQSKLRNQALVLKELGVSHKGLLNMVQSVRSGDPSNLEAHGARRYWIALFSSDFKRDKDMKGVNSMLNYVYAIIRSCVARGIMASGLHPSIGLHHCNTYNPMCLVDDLMEPFRPIGDYLVKKLSQRGYLEVDREVKTVLSKVAIMSIVSRSEARPLFQVIAQLSSSLAQVLSKEKKTWDDIVDMSIQFNKFKFDDLSLSQKLPIPNKNEVFKSL